MKVVLITGCSTGIGAHLALALARNGRQVFASMRRPEANVHLRNKVENEKLPCALLSMDVTDEESVRRCVEEVRERAGRIDVVINNAGIFSIGALESAPLQEAQQVFDVNYFGAVRVMRAVVPHMRERREGTIINISSLAGRCAQAAMSHYAASKHALEAVSECLALEVRRFNVRVVLIEPGFILTPMFGKGSVAVDESSPYLADLRRIALLTQRRLVSHRTFPRAVADAVEVALSSAEPKFRYLVGDDARLLATMRARVSDEEALSVADAATDEEYYNRMKALVGEDLYRD